MNTPKSVVSTERVFTFTPDQIYDAFRQPEKLERWWGPNGFTNTFHEFEFANSGFWVFTMHGPNGADYENTSEFQDLIPNEKIVIHHISPPHFVLTIALTPLDSGTRLRWEQEFDTPEIAEKMAKLSRTANEENLNRLEAVLARGRPGSRIL